MDNHLSAVGWLIPTSRESEARLSSCPVEAATTVIKRVNLISSPISDSSRTSRSIYVRTYAP